jgi:hypothetical protein
MQVWTRIFSLWCKSWSDFSLDTDPDPNFHFDADPVPDTVFIKVMRSCNDWSTDLPRLRCELTGLLISLHGSMVSLHGSFLSLYSSWILTLMRIRIRLLTTTRIRIRLFTLMRIHIRFPKRMRIRMRNIGSLYFLIFHHFNVWHICTDYPYVAAKCLQILKARLYLCRET